MLFRRKSSQGDLVPEAPPEPRTPVPTPPPDLGSRSSGSTVGVRSQSFIDASLSIMGDLHTDGDVQLDGRVCGNISCAQLIVGKDAAITGTVTAEQAVVRGTITGTIRSPVVILQDTARVESEITYTVLAVDDGATFEGTAHRSDRPLEEAEAVSPLEELRQMTCAGGHARGNGAGGADLRAPAVAPRGPEPDAAEDPDLTVVGGTDARHRPPEI